MRKFILIIIGFLVTGCQASESFINPIRPDFENVTFHVVQKQLIIETELPSHVEGLVSQWFEQKVKIDGFDGEMKFMISEYLEETTSISKGKRVDISLSFDVIVAPS